jgi:hypothetical protein
MWNLRNRLLGRGDNHAGKDASGLPRFIHGDSVIGPGFRFVWYSIPKNASGSILRTLTTSGCGRRLAEIAPGNPDKWIRRQARPEFSFVFVRNPFARVVSAWLDKIHSPSDSPGQTFIFERNPGLHAGMPLDQFVEWLSENLRSSTQPNPHWRRQTDFVTDASGETRVDFIGRVENIDRDFASAARHIGVAAKLPHRNRSPITNDPARLLSAHAQTLVKEAYPSDFEMFGYRTTLEDGAPLGSGTLQERQ